MRHDTDNGLLHNTDNGLLHDAIKILYVELTKLKDVINKPIEQMTDMEKF